MPKDTWAWYGANSSLLFLFVCLLLLFKKKKKLITTIHICILLICYGINPLSFRLSKIL